MNIIRPAFLPALLITVLSSSWAISPPDTSGVYISEIMATGGKITILDEDGVDSPADADVEDWIELHNPTGATISLTNWAVSDDISNPRRWVFPDVSIAPGEYMIVFASGKDRAPTQATIDAATNVIYEHTDFELENSGEYVGLIDDASQVVSELSPGYPFQYALYSFGYDASAGRYRYMHPTPGLPNLSVEAFDGYLSQDVVFDPPRGVYEDPRTVSLSSPYPGATIRYTTDHSAPGWATGTVYSTPIPVDDITTIRAMALIPGVSQSVISTHTYFVSPPELDLELPLMSLSMDPVDYTGPEGIAGSNIHNRGSAWERPGSIEYFDHENGTGFATNCGVRLHGISSRGQTKKTFRLYFRSQFGLNELNYPLIPDSKVSEFKRLILRGGSQDRDPFVRDEVSRRLMTDMGHMSCRGTLANGYVIGERRGYYNPCERLDRFFFRSWWGGQRDWDILGQDSPRDATGVYTGAKDGSPEVWNEILEIVHRVDWDGTDDEGNPLPGYEMNATDYEDVKARLDILNYIDYIQLAIVSGVNDWPGNNWIAARERDRVPEEPFRCYVWDHESSFGEGALNIRDTIASQLLSEDFKIKRDYRRSAPFMQMFRGLRHSPDFRKLVAERFRRNAYEDGGLTDSNMTGRYLDLRNRIVNALEADTATPHGIFTYSWIPGRRHNVEKQLDFHGLFDSSGISLHPRPTPDSLSINEFMAANDSTIADESSEYDDWIEIHNPTDQPVVVDGMYLTDDSSIPTKWQFPAGVTIEAGGYLLVWADGEPLEGPLHTTFKLERDGEEIALFASDGTTLLDSVAFVDQYDDVSVGRQPDGVGLFKRLETPSPGWANGPLQRTDFSDGFEIAVGRGARSVIAEDVNNDTLIDIVVGNVDYGAVTTFMNQGGGAFAQNVSTNTGRVGQAALVPGDFDGDNSPDLVAVNDTMLQYSVYFLKNDGNGIFVPSASATFNTAEPTRHLHPRSAVAKDIDGDSDLDLIVHNESSALDGFVPYENVVSILENDGAGQFSEKGSVVAGQTKLFSTQGLVAEDFDGDNDIDFATLSGSNSLLVSKNHGTGTFGIPDALIPTGAKPFSSVVGCDLDDDGDVDLVACEAYTPIGTDVHVLLNDGVGDFTESESYRVTLAMSETLHVNDFDGDGNVDILVSNFQPLLHARGSLQVLFNDGEGSFTVSDEFFPSHRFPFMRWIDSADLDGDGDQDLCVVDENNGALSVFQNVSYYAPPPSSVENWGLLDR